MIDDRHEIDQLVGHGGMAEVFRARDITTGQTVAIKFLRTVDPQSVSRFQTEHDVLSRLDHPGVIRLYGNGSHRGVPYLVLELVDGPTLADPLTDGALDIDQVRVHLADFGIARFSDTTRITATGTCTGTPAYLAPEQLQGHVGPASDIYALGLVILECLTGTHCYPGTIVETALARLQHAPTVPDDLPPWLHHTLRAMTALHPDRRPPAEATATAFCHQSVATVLAATSDLAVTAPGNKPQMAMPHDAALASHPHAFDEATGNGPAERLTA